LLLNWRVAASFALDAAVGEVKEDRRFVSSILFAFGDSDGFVVAFSELIT
jgi:hypothetical protein